MTTEATANGLHVLQGRITHQRVGAWDAELELDSDEAKKVTGDIELVTGNVIWKGTSVEVGHFVGRVKVRMVGGRRGLGKPTKPHFYDSMPARTVIKELLAEGGEVLSDASNAQKLETVLPFWTRIAGTVSEGLEHVLAEIGATWRVMPDGTVWVGVENWAENTPLNVIVESENPKQGELTFSSDTPSLLAGTTFRGRKVALVVHTISPGKTRTRAQFEGDGAIDAGADPVTAAIGTLVRQETKHFDFYAVRAGKVVSQNEDYTLELKLDDPALPGMSKIPIAYGIPGVRAKVKPGARVHLEFADGSPTKPRAVVVDSSGAIELQLTDFVKVVGGGDFVALAQKVDDGFAAIAQKYDAHSHGTGVGPTTPPVPPIVKIPSVACTKLKTD